MLFGNRVATHQVSHNYVGPAAFSAILRKNYMGTVFKKGVEEEAVVTWLKFNFPLRKGRVGSCC